MVSWKDLLEWAEASGLALDDAYQALLNMKFDLAKAKAPKPAPITKEQLHLPLEG
jgi:hypothetical protein